VNDETTKYKLGVYPGSGWGGANWLVTLAMPGSHSMILRHFETEEQARDEAAKMVVEIVQSSSERR
jgi:hypothetical protein